MHLTFLGRKNESSSSLILVRHRANKKQKRSIYKINMITLSVGVSITRGENLHSHKTVVTHTLSHERIHFETLHFDSLFSLLAYMPQSLSSCSIMHS